MVKSKTDLLDIFLITYNRASALEHTLSEIFASNSPIRDYEIKIIDNNSTDNTALVVQKYQEKFKNLLYEKNKYNIGGNANIVKAYYEANKKYVWVLCDDDSYNWDAWGEVLDAIDNDENAIIVSNTDEPQLNIAQLFAQTSFVPGVIYKTSLLDSEVFDNMTYNISNMFPHMAISAKMINEGLSFKILSDEIVTFGGDDIPLEQTYSRGVKRENIHPYRKNLMYFAGYANTVQFIKDKKLRNYILNNRHFYKQGINSLALFDLNNTKYDGSLYNLFCIFLAFDWIRRIEFIFKYLVSIVVTRIFYIYKNESYDKENDMVILDYRVKVLSLLKTKLFKLKVKRRMCVR